jgi:hypothetical protein
MRDSGAVLLDAENHAAVCTGIQRAIEAGTDDRIADLHVWRIGPHSVPASFRSSRTSRARPSTTRRGSNRCTAWTTSPWK